MSVFCVWICEFGFRCLRAFGLWMSGSWVEWVELRDTLKIGKRIPKSGTMGQWQADCKRQHGRRNSALLFGKALWHRSGDVRVDILQRLYKDPWHWLRCQLWEHEQIDMKKISIRLHIIYSFDILSCIGVLWLVLSVCDVLWLFCNAWRGSYGKAVLVQDE